MSKRRSKKRKTPAVSAPSRATVKTQAPPSSGIPSSAKSHGNLKLGIALLITALVFIKMMRNEFTNWDDVFYVVQNQVLRGPDWKGIFRETVVSNYHPLTIASLAFNYQVGALDPYSYLFTNYLLHIINTGLVFYLAWLLSVKNTWVAFFTALIFGIHPMHVESVAWVSERKDVLYTLFYLLACIYWWIYLSKNSKKYYIITFIFFLFSLLAKPAAVVLPLTLLLLDYWKDRPLRFNLLVEKIPFFIASIIFGYIALQIQSEKAIAAFEKYDMLQRVLFACHSLLSYLFYFFFPIKLSALHPFPRQLDITYYLSPIGVLLLAGLVVYFRRFKIIVFGSLFFVVNLLLVLQLLSFGNAVIAERYTYVPYIGLAFAAAFLASRIPAHSFLRKLVLFPAVFFIAWFCLLSFRRVQVWKNSETLWTDVLATYPNNPVASGNRGLYYLNQGRIDEALADSENGLKQNPIHQKCLDNKTSALLKKDDYPEALATAKIMVANYPRAGRAWLLRGYAFRMLDSTEQAEKDFLQAIKLDPAKDEGYSQMATLLANTKRDYKNALGYFTEAIARNPKGMHYLNRSKCYYSLGEKNRALIDAQTAIRLKEPGAAEFLKIIQQ